MNKFFYFRTLLFQSKLVLKCYMDLLWEKQAWKNGKAIVFGLDEVGRGPLSGPVTAAAVYIKRGFLEEDWMQRVDDSKRLSARKREELCKILICHPYIFWAVSWVTPQVIDKINILEATKRAMRVAVTQLERKIGKKAKLLLIDGNFPINAGVEERSVKKGDQKIFSCAAASIIAKVFRDRTMRRYHGLFPDYGFGQHKGYPTKLHRQALEKYGPCRIHRRTFRPFGQG